VSQLTTSTLVATFLSSLYWDFNKRHCA